MFQKLLNAMKHHLAIQVVGMSVVLSSLLLLSGCHTAPQIKTIVEYKNVPVKVADRYYETEPVPAPPAAREEMKKMTPRQVIDVQAEYIGTLHQYVGKLISQIAGIKNASNAAAERIEKEQKQ